MAAVEKGAWAFLRIRPGRLRSRRVMPGTGFATVLGLADDALILGHRLSEWTGHAPLLEEELALGNIALDLIGTARRLYQYAGVIEGKGRDEDAARLSARRAAIPQPAAGRAAERRFRD